MTFIANHEVRAPGDILGPKFIICFTIKFTMTNYALITIYNYASVNHATRRKDDTKRG